MWEALYKCLDTIHVQCARTLNIHVPATTGDPFSLFRLVLQTDRT